MAPYFIVCNFYFGFDLMIERPRHIVALSNNNTIIITLDEIWFSQWMDAMSDYFRLFLTISDNFRLFFTLALIFRWNLIFPMNGCYFWLFFDYFRLFQTIAVYFWLFITISDVFWVFQTIPDLFWLFLSISDYLRLLRLVLTISDFL